jgi:thiamine kinase
MLSDHTSALIKDWKLWPNICPEQPNNDNFKALVKGLTNSNLLFKSEDTHSHTKYVFRINAQNAQSLGLNRHAEWHIHQCIAQYNICKPYVYRDPKDIYWIRPFIESQTLQETLLNCSEQDTSIYLKTVAKKLKMTHSIPLSSAWPNIDFKQRTDHYWKQILKQIEDSKALSDALSAYKNEIDIQLKSPGYSLRLCHMDPNPNNWIIDTDNIYLIDWEYAAIGNPAWDIAVFCDSCNLTNEQKEQFLKDYGNGQIKLSQLEFADRQMKYLSALWYCVQKIISPENLLPALDELIKQS